MIGSIIFVGLTFLTIGTKAVWHQVWEDEFNGTKLSDTDWVYQEGCKGWGNNELECYTVQREENVKTENGHLIIHINVEEFHGRHFTSGRINTKHSWTFGKFEIKAKLPKGKNLWPAIWMMPEKSVYGVWAASGEIDIMEYRGERTNQIQGTIHYGGSWPRNHHSGSGSTNFTTDFSADYHIFALEWEAKEMRWYLDGKLYHTENIDKMMHDPKSAAPNPYTKNGQPFDIPFHLILNVAVGGNFFPTSAFGPHITPAEAKNWDKPTMEVDYVRVWEWKE